MTLFALKSTFGDETELLGVFSTKEKAAEAFKAVAWDANEVCSMHALECLADTIVDTGACTTYNTAYVIEKVEVDELLVGLSQGGNKA